MRLLNLGVLLFTMNIAYSQLELNRIDKSNFFTNQKDIFYVFSNKMNSSGILGEVMETVDTLQVSNQEGSRLVNTVQVVSKELFIDRFNLGKQYFKSLTIAIIIPKVQFKNFEIVNKNYAKSNGLVLDRFEIIEGADYESFKILNGVPLDKSHVFHKGQIIEKANPKTFEYINNQYSKDDKYVFHYGEILQGADPKSFQALTYTYQKDSKYVWVYGMPTKIDVNSFKILEYNYPEGSVKHTSLYSVDKNHVYFQGEMVLKADSKSFKLITSGAPYQTYGIDKNHVFYSGELLELAHVRTFKVIKNKNSKMNYDAQDKKYFYSRDEKTIANTGFKK